MYSLIMYGPNCNFIDHSCKPKSETFENVENVRLFEAPSWRFCFVVKDITIMLEIVFWKRTFGFQTADNKLN